MTANKSFAPFLLVVALSFASCSANYERMTFDSAQKQAYLDQLERFREGKDVFLKSSTSSPLTDVQKASFHHLNYYPPNFNLIFKVKMLMERKPERIGIAATGGETRPAIRYGKFEFNVDGKKIRLFVYKMLGDDSGELFLPFTDETCGKTSYSGGRYIDLSEDGTGEYTLDFNYAYNPYCAYNHNYSCPIVPGENYLDVEIKAGEMKF